MVVGYLYIKKLTLTRLKKKKQTTIIRNQFCDSLQKAVEWDIKHRCILRENQVVALGFWPCFRSSLVWAPSHEDLSRFQGWGLTFCCCCCGTVTLLFCISLCCSTKWFSYVWTYIPSLKDLPLKPPTHPSRSPQSSPMSFLRVTADSHLFYSWWCRHVDPSLPVHPPPSTLISTCPVSPSACVFLLYK